MRRWLWIGSMALLFFLFSGATRAASGTVPSSQVFTMRLLGEPETLDWNLAHTSIETHILKNLMEGLVEINERLKVVPALAERWVVSPDGLTYTFYLRKDVKWSDGTPLKAQDFEFSWRRLLLPTTGASYAYLLYDVAGAEEFNRGELKDFSKVGIRAQDATTFQVRLKRRVAHWVSLPAFWVLFPLREDIVTRHGTAWNKPGNMVTVGPFTLESHDAGMRIVMRENGHYYRKKGNIKQVVALVITDDATALNLYETGKLDFLTDISTLDLKRLQNNPELKSFAYLKTGYLGFNLKNFPVSNVKVRRAIAMAIDKSKIGTVLHGGQVMASSFVPPPLFSHSPQIGLRFDPKKAKELLKESGLQKGTSVKLDLLTPHMDKALTLSQYLQGQLKKNLDLDVTIQPFDHKTFRAQIALHTYPSFVLTWAADFPDPDNFLSVFLSDSGNNRTQFVHKKYDEWVLQARSSSSEVERKKLYLQSEKTLIEEEAALVPLFYEPNKALVKRRVRGLRLSPMNDLFLKDVNLGF